MDNNLPKSEENNTENNIENNTENKAENNAENNTGNNAENDAESNTENNAENDAENKTENNAGNNAENSTENNAEVKQDAVYPECASEDFIMQADVERDTQRGCADDEEMLEAMRQKIPVTMAVYAGPQDMWRPMLSIPLDPELFKSSMRMVYAGPTSISNLYSFTDSAAPVQNGTAPTVNSAGVNDGSNYVCELCGTFYNTSRKFCDNCGGIVKSVAEDGQNS